MLQNSLKVGYFLCQIVVVINFVNRISRKDNSIEDVKSGLINESEHCKESLKDARIGIQLAFASKSSKLLLSWLFDTCLTWQLFDTFIVHKVQIFREGHRNLPLSFDNT